MVDDDDDWEDEDEDNDGMPWMNMARGTVEEDTSLKKIKAVRGEPGELSFPEWIAITDHGAHSEGSWTITDSDSTRDGQR